MTDVTDDWFRRRTTTCADWPLAELLRVKESRAGSTISVVLPARDEQSTVGRIVAAIKTRLMDEVPLVDELVVIDSDSRDRTGEAAAEAGAIVHRSADILPQIPAGPGKGEALWRSLFVTRGEIVCFIDADLRHFRPAVVQGLAGPLLADPTVSLVKAACDRPADSTAADGAFEGGRVTELLARPLLNAHWPAWLRSFSRWWASTLHAEASWNPCTSPADTPWTSRS